ncbi:MAG: FAD-dependent oxidoreductase, partial [bacterium]
MAKKYDYDVLAIGLGPAGMAVSVMGSSMGLKVAAVERHKIGGECLNYGCIPSKALLKTAKVCGMFNCLEDYGLCKIEQPVELKNPMERMRGVVKFVNEGKTAPMFDKVDLYLGEGHASFVDPHTVQVGDRKITAKYIYIATGTSPAIPPIPGLSEVPYLTNSNIWSIEKPPESMTIIGGGAIGTEMAQTFSRFGTHINVVHMDPHLVPAGDPDAAAAIEQKLTAEGVTVHNGARITGVEKQGDDIVLKTEDGAEYRSRELLVAAGRKVELDSLKLENAGIKYDKAGIKVDKPLRTSRKNVFAIGDCNGHYLLTHAAMHQGMISLMIAMMPGPFKLNFKKYVVPWTVF